MKLHGIEITNIKKHNYYEPQNIALQLYCEDGPYCTASINLPYDLPKDCVAIKDYSENEGVLDFLVSNGIVSAPVKYVNSGFCFIPVCRCLI